MKTPKIYYGVIAVYCVIVLVIGTVSASGVIQQGTGNNLKDRAGQFGSDKMLDNLTAQGYDVSAIRAAVESGDYKTAMTLMQEFRTAHPDALPARGEGAGKGPMDGQANGKRILRMLDNLTVKGYDVSAIRTAVTSGDYKTARTLLQEFRTAQPNAFPSRSERAGSGHPC